MALSSPLRSASALSHPLARSLAPCARRHFFQLPWQQAAPSAGNKTVRDGITYYSESKTMPYTQEQLYAVVADVDSYAGFIPMCTSSKVIEARPYGVEGRPWLSNEERYTREQELRAMLQIGFKGMEAAYVSRVTCKRPERVKAAAESSPLLKHLSSTWSFKSASSSETQVTFDLAYAFADATTQLAAGAFFDRVSSKIVTAFEQRCRELYGGSSR